MEGRIKMDLALLVQITGIMLATAIPVVVLIFTLRSSRKIQAESNNLQNALKWQEVIATDISRERQNITEAYNQIERLLFLGAALRPSARELDAYIGQVNEMFVLFRQSINNVRFNTSIYTAPKQCEGCTLCDIKLKGDLVRCAVQLRTTFIAIDAEISESINFLTISLNLARESLEQISLKSNLEQLNINSNALISRMDDSRDREEISKLKANIEKNILEIGSIDSIIDKNFESTKENNDLARAKINTVYIKMKPALDEAIFSYFTTYNQFSKQGTWFVQKNGKPNRICRKFFNDTQQEVSQ